MRLVNLCLHVAAISPPIRPAVLRRVSRTSDVVSVFTNTHRVCAWRQFAATLGSWNAAAESSSEDEERRLVAIARR
jgi:hypothetical protein